MDRWLSRWMPLQAYHPGVKELFARAYEFTRGFMANPAAGQLLVIYGGSGNGKTSVAKAIHKWVCRVDGLPLVDFDNHKKTPDSHFCNWPKVVDGFKEGDWDITDAFTHTLTTLDDIGAEHDPSTVGREKLYRILEERVKKWSIVTTNIEPELWKKKFENRIADRLFRNSIHVDMSKIPSFSAQ